MKHAALIFILACQLSCSSEETEDSGKGVDMSMPDAGSDLSTGLTMDQGDPDVGVPRDLSMAMNRDLDMALVPDLAITDMRKTYKSVVSTQRTSCDILCQGEKLTCNGEYQEPIFQRIAGKAQYGGKSFVAVRTCTDVPKADRVSPVSGNSAFVDVECYCVEG